MNFIESNFYHRCATSTCVNQIGYVDYDYSKPYPECCPHPICGWKINHGNKFSIFR